MKDLLGDKSLEQVVDEATRKQLESWFGLPSFTELVDRGVPPEELDPEMNAVRERRAKAIAAVDPALVADIKFRTEDNPETLLDLELTLDVVVDPDISRFDIGMAERAAVIAEPRQVEIPDQIYDDLKECVPQALLRDLHRPETYFDKQLEIVDVIAAERVDASAVVARAMREARLQPPVSSEWREARELLAELRRDRRRPWPELFAALPLPNRKVQE
ncbi:MAG TPA: hypothetical protein VMJ10_19675 [Kofleriaceae bacterium]|nr:hypothetical protein [Kofleriaceae bacterium]